MRTLFASIGVGIAVREFARMLDVTTNVDNRLRLVTDSTDRLNAVYGELLDIANRTRTPLAANADLFNRFAIAGREAGRSYQDVLDVVERVNQALQISGTSAQAAEGALVQLGQGLSAGALRGEEFNSVNEAIPRLMQAIADEMGVARGALRELAAEGAITSEVIFAALENQGQALADEFARITPTISGAFEVFNNNMLNFVRNLNAASGIGEIFARGILFLADNFNAVAGAAAGLAIIIGGVLVRAIAGMTIALAANPIGLIVVAIAAATAAIGAFGDRTVEVGGRVATVWQIIKAAVMTAVDVFVRVKDAAVDMFSGMLAAGGGFFSRITEWLNSWGINWREVLSTIGNFIKTAINTWIGLHVGFVGAIGPVITEGIPALFRLAMGTAQNVVVGALETIINTFVSALGSLGDALDYIPGIEGVGASIRDALSVNLDGMRADTEALRGDLSAAASGIASDFSDALNTDYIGNFTGALAEAGSVIRDDFNANLEEVIENTEHSININELLQGSLSNGVVPALNDTAAAAGGAAGAMSELNREREEFIESITDEYAAIMEQSGGAVAAVEAWYNEQSQRLRDLGLEYTQYADMLETIFGERMAEAYRTDLENAEDWRSGIERAVAGLGESIGTEADLAEAALTSLFNNAANAIVEFAKTGKFDFKEFARSVAADILMLTTRMLLFRALSSFLPGLSGGGIAGFAQGGFVQMAGGGSVRGPGTPTSDSIPAMLSNGEFVVNAAATKDFLPLLEAINSGNMDMMALAAGGLSNESATLPAQPAPAANPQPDQGGGDSKQGGNNLTIIPTINGSDIIDQFDSDDGDRVLINMLERNKTTIRGVLS